MKKIIAGALALSMGSALAGNVMPEMTRDGKTKNDNLGVAWSKRNAAVLSYDTLTQDREVSGTETAEVKTTNLNPYVFGTHGAFSAELSYNINKVENTPKTGTSTETDTNSLDLDAAYRINDMFAVTFGYGTEKEESTGSEETEKDMVFGFSYNHGNGLIAGVSYSLSNQEDVSGSTTTEVDYSVISLGVGYQNWNNKDGYTVEAFYQTRGKEKDTQSVGDMTNLELHGTYAMGAWELDGVFGTMKEENYAGTTETTTTTFGLDFEYMINANIYVTPQFAQAKAETETGSTTSETKVTTFGSEFGYRTAMWDANLELAQVKSETDSSNTEDSGLKLGVNFGYFF